MKRYTMFLDWKNQHCENDYTTQGSLQIYCNYYRITNGIFHRTKKILKLVWRHERPQIEKTILRKKNGAGRIRFSEFGVYYKATVIKTVQHWHKKGNVDQYNRIESPEINSHTYGQLVYNKGGKSIQWRQGSLYNKWFWENWTATCKRRQLRNSLYYTQKEAQNGLKP